LSGFLNYAVGCWVLGVGCWVLGAGCWVKRWVFWMLGGGCWMLGEGRWVFWVLGGGCGIWELFADSLVLFENYWFPISFFRFRSSQFVLPISNFLFRI
jgi:hypothetical protein